MISAGVFLRCIVFFCGDWHDRLWLDEIPKLLAMLHVDVISLIEPVLITDTPRASHESYSFVRGWGMLCRRDKRQPNIPQPLPYMIYSWVYCNHVGCWVRREIVQYLWSRNWAFPFIWWENKGTRGRHHECNTFCFTGSGGWGEGNLEGSNVINENKCDWGHLLKLFWHCCYDVSSWPSVSIAILGREWGGVVLFIS